MAVDGAEPKSVPWLASSPGHSPWEQALAGKQYYYHYVPSKTDIKKHGPAYAAAAAMLKAQAKANKKMAQWKVDDAVKGQAAAEKASIAAAAKAAKDAQEAKPHPWDFKPKGAGVSIDESSPLPTAPAPTTTTPSAPEPPAFKPPTPTTKPPKGSKAESHAKTDDLRKRLDLSKLTTEELNKASDKAHGDPYLKAILDKAGNGKPKGFGRIAAPLEHFQQDTVGTVMDILSRPQQAVGGGIIEALNQANAHTNKTGNYGMPVTNWSDVGWAALHGFEGKNKTDFIPVAQKMLESTHPGLKANPKDPVWRTILKRVPGVLLGGAADVVTDPVAITGAGLGTTTAGLAAETPEEAKIAQAGSIAGRASAVIDAEQRLSTASTAYAEILKARKAAADIEEAHRADKKATPLVTVQKTNKELADLTTKLAPQVKRDAVSAGMTQEEIDSLHIGESVAARDISIAHPRPEELTKTPHQAAKEILDDLGKTGARADAPERQALVAKKALDFAKENKVREEALANTQTKIAAARAQGETLGAAKREEIFQESLAEITGDRARATSKLLDDAMQRRFSIRGLPELEKIPGVEKSLRALYVPFEKGNIAFKGTVAGDKFTRALSIKAHFHEASEDIRRLAEQTGIVEASDFNNKVRKAFRGVSDRDKRVVTDAVQGGYDLASNPKLEELRQLMLQENKTAFDKLVAVGKYKKDDEVPNFVYHRYKGGTSEDLMKFRKDRKAALSAGRKGPTLEEAAIAGLKPERRADSIMLHQHMDMAREVQKSNFRQQIISKFGALMDNPAQARELGLEEVPHEMLNKMFQDKAALKGKDYKWYLPPELHKTFKAMDEMLSSVQVGEGQDFLKFMDRAVRSIKTQATVLSPGNWVNNTAGDMFLNWLDGVRNPMWYKKSAHILRMGDNAGSDTVRLAGHNYKSDELLKLFKEKAPSGGFIRIEGGKMGDSRFIPGRKLHAGMGHIQNAYESREEFGRFAHFLSSMNEEVAKGGSLADAAERAGRRVAKYNLDYTALTPFERKLRKNFVPFYTFMRKSAPLMLETLAQNPGKFSNYNRAEKAIGQLMGAPPVGEDTDQTTWPLWAKQAGGIRLNRGAEPNYIRDPSPLNIFPRVLGGQTGLSGIAANLLGQANPISRGVNEFAYRRSLFNGQPITNWKNWWASQIPLVNQAASLTNHPLVLGTSATPKKGLPMAIMNYLGIPISKLTENQQQSELHRRLASQPQTLKKANEVFAPGHLEVKKHTNDKHGTYYTLSDISDPKNSKVINRYRDPVKAFEDASARMMASQPSK